MCIFWNLVCLFSEPLLVPRHPGVGEQGEEEGGREGGEEGRREGRGEGEKEAEGERTWRLNLYVLLYIFTSKKNIGMCKLVQVHDLCIQ